MARDDIAARGEHPSRWARLAVRSRRAGAPRRFPGSGHPLRALLIGGVLIGYAWIDAAVAPLTTTALIGVLIPGAVLGAIACRPPVRIPPPEELDIGGISYWIICLVALFEWEASAFRDNSLSWHPSLTNLINPVLGPHVMKSAAILVWLAAGWGLVKR
jgi:hypothetical protein